MNAPIMKKSIDKIAKKIAKGIYGGILSPTDIEEIIESDINISEYFRVEKGSAEESQAIQIMSGQVVQNFYKMLIKPYQKWGYK